MIDLNAGDKIILSDYDGNISEDEVIEASPTRYKCHTLYITRYGMCCNPSLRESVTVWNMSDKHIVEVYRKGSLIMRFDK